jgi:hypothetical protein
VEERSLTRLRVRAPARPSIGRRAPEVQEAIRRRLADRAFAEHVRAMARRLGPPGTAGSDPLARL